ncbi:MAG: thiamine pyrophosphate-binding protein [Micromonosporaceae bacterium]
MTTAMTAAHALIDVLLSWGVRHVFTCPGSTEAPFLDASIDRPELEVCLATHELTAVSMADGYARFAGGVPGVAYLHTNVGLTNGLGAMYAAQLARSPVVVLNGLKASVIQARRGFTAIPDVGGFAAPHAKWTWQSLRSQELASDLSRALQLATASPPGPVWLGLPEDLMAAPAEQVASPPRRSRAVSAGRPATEQVAAAAAALSQARRPLLVAGADVAREGAWDLLVALSERLGATVVNEDRRSFERSAFPTDHPHYAGFYANRLPAVVNADVIAFLGGRCFHEFEAGAMPGPPDQATVIHSNADPVEIGKTHGADITLTGDHRAILAELLAAIPEHHHRDAPGRVDATAGVTISHGADTVSRGADQFEDRLTVAATMDALAAVLDASAGAPVTIVADATTSNSALFSRVRQQRASQLVTTSCGALGWGTGAALGVAVARPGERVVAVLGDGSFQFGLQALWVAARRRVPVTFVVVNNESYAAVAAALRRYGRRAVAAERYPGKDIAGPHLAEIAQGHGVPAERVETPAQLTKALATAIAADGPRMVEVMTDPADLGPS